MKAAVVGHKSQPHEFCYEEKRGENQIPRVRKSEREKVGGERGG